MIGERIRQARKMKGLSLRELASRAGVSAQAISNYENGKDLPDSEVLIRLARALDRKIEFFLRPRTVGEIKPAYRKKGSLSEKNLQRITAHIQEWLERYLQIEDILSENEEGFLFPKGFPLVVNTLEEAERAAIVLRQAWDIGMDPIFHLTELLEDKGLKVGEIKDAVFLDGCAFFVEEDCKIPVILCSSHVPGDRQRFTLAHELGHLVLRTGLNIDREKAANRFAGAFLVPNPVVVSELGVRRQRISLLELHLLKHKYGISMQAWILRAQDVGVLTSSAAKDIFIHFRVNGWHQEEPGDPYPREQTLRMERMVLRALSQQIISEKKAEELLGTSWSNLEKANL